MAAALVAVPVVAVAVYALRTWPPINDITTDTADPPAFVALVAERTRAGATSPYPGEHVARAQQAAYPDLAPVIVAVPPLAAFATALSIVRANGWTVVAEDAGSGHLEAVATTSWLRFHDDVVIRIRPEGAGSRIDVRSASRVGRGDLGTNARRIREFAARMVAAR